MRTCARCGGGMDQAFRYCPWCAQPQRLKLVEFFWPHPRIEGDRTKALRVSRYFAPTGADRHVRFSVWNDSNGPGLRAQAAVSIDDDEARRLAAFLRGSEPRIRRPGPLEQLRDYVRALR